MCVCVCACTHVLCMHGSLRSGEQPLVQKAIRSDTSRPDCCVAARPASSSL